MAAISAMVVDCVGAGVEEKFEISFFLRFGFQKIAKSAQWWQFGKMQNRHFKTWNSVSILNFRARNSISKIWKTVFFKSSRIPFRDPKNRIRRCRKPSNLGFRAKIQIFSSAKILVLKIGINFAGSFRRHRLYGRLDLDCRRGYFRCVYVHFVRRLPQIVPRTCAKPAVYSLGGRCGIFAWQDF